MRKPRILVVGSCNMDFTFEAERFVKEGETIMGTAFSTAQGGKGANQARQAAKAGADVTFLGKMGHDSNAEQLIAILKSDGIDTSKMLFSDTEPTGCACIELENREGGTRNRIIVVSGAQVTFTEEELSFLKEEIRNYDMVILQLEINMDANELVAKYAHDAGVPVMLNSAPSAPLSDSFLANLTYISPNEHEASDMTGIKVETVEDAREACRALCDKGVENVIITMGSQGAVIGNREKFVQVPCVKTTAVDPTAAGDSFVGAFCTAVAAGMEWNDALTFASHAASITVSRKGAGPSLPYLSEIKELLARTGSSVDAEALASLE